MSIVRHPENQDYFDFQMGTELSDGETLTGTPTVVNAGLTISNISIQDESGGKAQSVVRAKITGGTHGKAYQVQVNALTSSGREIVTVRTYFAFSGA